MSLTTVTQVTCPRCGRAQEVTLWESINVTLDPSLRDQLLDGYLSRFECGSCGAEAQIDHSLLYHDMSQRFMVWQLDPESRKQVVDHDPMAEVAAAAPALGELMGQMNAGYRMRLVGSRQELVEKVYVFDSGWDDRVVETMKALVWSRIQEQQSIDRGLLLFQPADKDVAARDALSFTLILPDGRSGTIPLQGIGAMLDSLSAHFAGEPAPKGWIVLDQQAGAELLRRWERARNQ